MKRLFSLIMAGIVGLMVWSGAALAVEGGYSKQKVVYHVNGDDPKQQTGALRNIQNHINAVGKENLDLRVVMHGHGVSLVLLPEALGKVKGFRHANADQQMQARIDGLKDQGVQFKVCNNTLVGRKTTVDDLYMVDQADIVPSGVAELAHLQSQGFTYIKP
ncbi:MAG: DsrE family protein [Gammaproteobacteria bacterium]|nr:DsrE family protein [Gammaproteobacteria bacterium]